MAAVIAIESCIASSWCICAVGSGPPTVARVAAKHTNTRSKLATAKRHHMLANVRSNLFPVGRTGVLEDPLNEIVTILVTGN